MELEAPPPRPLSPLQVASTPGLAPPTPSPPVPDWMFEYIKRAKTQMVDIGLTPGQANFLPEVRDQVEYLYHHDTFNGRRPIEMDQAVFRSVWDVYIEQQLGGLGLDFFDDKLSLSL